MAPCLMAGTGLDGVELLHHLRQAPGAQRREDDNAEQVEQIGPEEADEGALHGRTLGGDLRQRDDGLGEAAVVQDDRHDDSDNAEQHNDALNEVVHNRSHVPAKHHVNASDHRHADDAHIVGQREGHAEQARQAIVDAGGIRDEEHEDDGRRRDAQGAGIVALAEELRHGGCLQTMGHLAGTGA